AQKLHWCSEQIVSIPNPNSQAIESQLAPCVSMLQRLSLLRLTVLMDKFSPFSKQGWN
ncbi:rho GTPase-activating protein 7-like isoform X1, partial [Clarias magur]